MNKIISFVSLVAFLFPLVGCGQSSAEIMNPNMLLKEVDRNGPESVYNDKLTGEQWIHFVNMVETGENGWVKLAAAIYPATDAGTSEMLTLALGTALERAPKSVLSVVKGGLNVDGICGYPDMSDNRTDEKQEVVDYLDKRIGAVKLLSGKELDAVRMQCLESLEATKREVIGPSGPFSNTTK